MDRYQLSLRIWRELPHDQDFDSRLAQFAEVLKEVRRLPEGTDLQRCVDLVGRARTWLPNATAMKGLEYVVDAICSGLDPGSIDDSLRFILQAQTGFAMADPATLAFRYTFIQIRSARQVWEQLPPPDRAAVQVDALLEHGLEDQIEIVLLVVGLLQSIQGPGLKVARLLKDAMSPATCLELWWALRPRGPVRPMDYELLQRVINVVGLRPALLEEVTRSVMEGHQAASLFSHHG